MKLGRVPKKDLPVFYIKGKINVFVPSQCCICATFPPSPS